MAHFGDELQAQAGAAFERMKEAALRRGRSPRAPS